MMESPIRPASVDTSVELARPSSFTTRVPRLGVQTRMRARSVNSGSGASTPVPALSPTLAGSPNLPGTDTFLVNANQPSPLGWSPTRPNHHDEDEDDETDRSDGIPGLDENGSTESESPPPTPAHVPRGQSSFKVSSSWLQAKLPRQPMANRADFMPPSLKESTRHNLRRGRSFTSLLVQPTTPSPAAQDRPDPIAEQFEPKSPVVPVHSDIESGAEQPLAYGSSVSCPVNNGSAAARKTLRDFVPQVALLVALFVGSFVFIAALISTLPNLFIPHAVSDLPALTSALSTYRASSAVAELHLFSVLTILFLWKQCFSIPGSVLTNILFGALYGTAAGTWWACLWTALGSTGAYGIALVISPLVSLGQCVVLSALAKCLPGRSNITSLPRWTSRVVHSNCRILT